MEIFSGILSALKVLNFPNQLILADHCMSWIGCVFTNLERQALEGLGLVENFQLQVTQGFGQQLSYIFQGIFQYSSIFGLPVNHHVQQHGSWSALLLFQWKKRGGGGRGAYSYIFWVQMDWFVSYCFCQKWQWKQWQQWGVWIWWLIHNRQQWFFWWQQ